MRWIDNELFRDGVEFADPLDLEPTTVEDLMTALYKAAAEATKALGRQN